MDEGRGRREVRFGAVEVRRGSREEWDVEVDIATVRCADSEWLRGVRTESLVLLQ